jgi:hypothetical protein
MKDTITFETITQAAIFDLELKGQISDGHWENDASSNYETWCDATVLVSDDEENLGRDFYVSKNLGFGSKSLFDIVGDRMAHYGRMALVADRVFPDADTQTKIDIASTLEDCIWDFDDKPSWKGLPKWKREAIMENTEFAEKYVIPTWNLICDAGPIKLLETAAKVFAEYTEDDARKDTRRISAIAKKEK